MLNGDVSDSLLICVIPDKTKKKKKGAVVAPAIMLANNEFLQKNMYLLRKI